jgi:hypothetical protein
MDEALATLVMLSIDVIQIVLAAAVVMAIYTGWRDYTK